jgi:hypothetical protein
VLALLECESGYLRKFFACDSGSGKPLYHLDTLGMIAVMGLGDYVADVDAHAKGNTHVMSGGIP